MLFPSYTQSIPWQLCSLFNAIAFIIIIPTCKYIGRRKSFLGFLMCGIVFNFVAIPDVEVSVEWRLDRVAGIIRSIAISSCLGVLYLHTSELAPTSHRGMILPWCGSSACLGSIVCFYLALLSDVTDREVPFVVFAVAALVCCILVFCLPDTTRQKLSETPRDVVMRVGNSKEYQSVKGGWNLLSSFITAYE